MNYQAAEPEPQEFTLKAPTDLAVEVGRSMVGRWVFPSESGERKEPERKDPWKQCFFCMVFGNNAWL